MQRDVVSDTQGNVLTCSSMLSPPTSSVYRSVVYFAMAFRNLAVCIASSRVGDSTIARTPTRVECSFNRSKIGMRNVAVLP